MNGWKPTVLTFSYQYPECHSFQPSPQLREFYQGICHGFLQPQLVSSLEDGNDYSM